MSKLNLKSFISFSGDSETDQYRILGMLKDYSENFRKKKLYPDLAELINLVNSLEGILRMKKGLEDPFPKHITGFDLENQKIIFEDNEVLDQNLESLFELVEWVLPILKQTIEERTVLYDFVDKNINVDEVGILPLYKDEGYLIIPDNTIDKFIIHRFHFALFRGENVKYRTLKTRFIDAVEKELTNMPEYIKQILMDKYKDITNPATFYFHTDLEIPIDETLFPVVKRKLLSRFS